MHMNPINTGSGTSFPLRTTPDKQPSPNPAEQQVTDSEKADEKTLRHRDTKAGKGNFQRLLASDKASSSGGISANVKAEVDNGNAGRVPQSGSSQTGQAHATAAEGSDARRRAARAQRENENGGWAPSRILKMYVSAMALFAGYRAIRNPDDFKNHPGPAIAGVLGISARADEQTLLNSKNAVLERFGNYIPKDAHCHDARSELVWGTSADPYRLGVQGQYRRSSNTVVLRRYHPLLGSGGPQLPTPTSIAVHEYCHCFTHPKFTKALENSDKNYVDINESLTEYIGDKVPVYGLFSAITSKMDSAYDFKKMANGKNMVKAARELEKAVGEATLMRAYFGGDKNAIRKVLRAADKIYPKKTTA